MQNFNASNFKVYATPSIYSKKKKHTVTGQGEIVADRLQSTFSPTEEYTKLAAIAFTFCSLETLCHKKKRKEYITQHKDDVERFIF